MIIKMLYHTITILALALSCVTAWWDVGHMLTAVIAEIKLNELDPYAYVHFKDLVASMNHLSDQKSQTFVQSASWPDDIKSSKYNMNLWNAWHYKDMTYITDGVFPVINFTEVTVNSVRIIDEAVKVLKSNINKTTAERALFSRYLVHVAGDIHQPLHSVALFNQTFPNGDIGGNRIKVDLLNSTKNFNFHSFWDSGALRIQNDSWTLPRPLSLQNQTTLREYAQDLISQYGKEVQGLGQIIDPVVWSKESLEIAKNTTYPFVFNNKEITEQYSVLVHETCKKRITLAGYRIANIVIDIYKQNTKDLQDCNLDRAQRYEQRRKQLFTSTNDPILIEEN